MSTLHELLPLSPGALHARMEAGHPIDPAALHDVEYHGVSLGLPAVVERLAWKTFKKVFRRDPRHGVLRGWNVAVEQHGPDGPFVDRTRRGRRVTYGHYEVWPAGGYALPGRYGHGLVIDYGRGGNPPWDPTRLVKDPLVAVVEGSAELLLGYSLVDLGPFQLRTPSYFLLTRGGPLTYDVSVPWRRA